MSYGVGCSLGSDPALLQLWCRPAATAPIHPLAWEPPYAGGTALKRPNQKKRHGVVCLGDMTKNEAQTQIIRTLVCLRSEGNSELSQDFYQGIDLIRNHYESVRMD